MFLGLLSAAVAISLKRAINFAPTYKMLFPTHFLAQQFHATASSASFAFDFDHVHVLTLRKKRSCLLKIYLQMWIRPIFHECGEIYWTNYSKTNLLFVQCNKDVDIAFTYDLFSTANSSHSASTVSDKIWSFQVKYWRPIISNLYRHEILT